MQAQQDLIRTIAFMNDYASTYHATVEDSSHIFFTHAHKALSPSVVDYLKRTPCTVDISNEEWTMQLTAAGYHEKDIRPFDESQLNSDYPSLKTMIRNYIKNPQNRYHSMYEAIQNCIKDYRANPNFSSTIDLLVSPYGISSDKGESLFKKAFHHQQTMSPLKSFCMLLATEFGIKSPIYFQAIQLMDEANQNLSQKWPIDKSIFETYFQDKAEALIQIALEQGDLQQFYSNLNAELHLFDLCGQDHLQLKKMLAILTQNPQEISPADRTLAGIQKIQQLATKVENISLENYFDGRPEAATWQAILPLFNRPYMYQLTEDAIQARLHPPLTMDNFELFPGEKLIDVLDKNAGTNENEKRSMRDVLIEEIKKRNPVETNKIILENISRIYQLDGQKTQALFTQALQHQDQDTLTREGSLIQTYTGSTLSFDVPMKKLIIVEQQLTSLLANKPEAASYIPTYLENQKQQLLLIAQSEDPDALESFTNQINVVHAVGDLIEGHPSLSQKLKQRSGTGALQEITLLSECLKDLKAESPEKMAAIQNALTEVLTNTPDITFDKLVSQMRDPNLDKNSPVGKLKDVMGKHRNIFWWLVSLVYPFETKTTQFFREKMIDKVFTDNDLGREPPSPSNTSN